MQLIIHISCVHFAFGAHSAAFESVVIASAPHIVSLVICSSISNNSLIVGSMHMHTNRQSIISEHSPRIQMYLIYILPVAIDLL